MKLATAPTLGLPRRIAAISAPMSKSPVCTRTGMLAPRYRRHQRHRVAVPDEGIGAGHVLVDRNKDRFARRQLMCPGPPSFSPPRRQPRHALPPLPPPPLL